jgi:hypothetical protein
LIETSCFLWGENFHPSDIKSIDDIHLHLVDDPGSIGITGRYKNKILPHGACYIRASKSIPEADKIIWMANFIKTNKKIFIDAGATKIEFWILWHGNQGNMEFTPAELKMIASSDIPLCIDYLYVDEDK